MGGGGSQARDLPVGFDFNSIAIHKHLPDPFYLEGTTSISIRDAIFREVASNLLIHREAVHFDTRQYSIVAWANGNIPDFARRLALRVEATLGPGPRKIV